MTLALFFYDGYQSNYANLLFRSFVILFPRHCHDYSQSLRLEVFSAFFNLMVSRPDFHGKLFAFLSSEVGCGY